MGEPKVSAPDLKLTIADGQDVSHMFERFEWKSFTNGGYIIRARLIDPNWNIIKKFATQGYLQKGRKEPTKVKYELKWIGNESTGEHVAYMTDFDMHGVNAGGLLEFIAVDPPSYWLNAGDSSGRVYEGSVKKVIEKVIDDYFIGPNPDGGDKKVSDTLDFNKNKWWMMRMDPKTFIGSLLDWSASITQKKTNWIVSSDGSTQNGKPTIWIREQADRETKNYGLYVMDVKSPSGNDAYNFQLLADNYISVFQKQLFTSGISAVSGRYLDRKMEGFKEKVLINDEQTPNKKNVSIGPKQGFAKPAGSAGAIEQPYEWSSAVMAIPEFNGGDLGLTYDKYIDGRARTLFMNMLNLVMRIKLRVTGEPLRDLASSHNLGVSKLKIAWIDADSQPYFIDGDWLVYGFHHVMTRNGWDTDLYCARLDFDSEAQKV